MNTTTGGPGILPGGLSVELPHRLWFITDRAAEVNPSRGKHFGGSLE